MPRSDKKKCTNTKYIILAKVSIQFAVHLYQKKDDVYNVFSVKQTLKVIPETLPM